MGFINQGSQFITFDFKHKAKGSDFNKLNRNVLRPGIYSGLKATYVGNNVFMSIGTCVFNCAYGVENNLQVKINFDSIYDYGVINPTTLGQNEVLYLEYEYGEVLENYADFKHTSYNSFNFNNENLIIIGEIIYDQSYNISSISYVNRTLGFNNADLNYAIPDNTKYYNILDESKFFTIDGSQLPTGTRKIKIPNFTESEGDILITNDSNTTIVKNRLSALKFYGRVPIGSVIPVIGAFSSSGNSGIFTSASLPSSGSITDDGFQRCDGAIINNDLSVFNGKYTPDISDNRFIQGSTTGGTVGGGGNNGNNTHTISISNLPTHTHDISHTHTGTTTSQSSSTTSNAGSHVHGVMRSSSTANGNSPGAFFLDANYIFQDFLNPVPVYFTNSSVLDGSYTLMNSAGNHNHTYSHTHDISTNTQSITTSGNGGFANTSIDIRPKYISAVYLIRVL